VDAIVVASGLMAAGALRALRRSGRRVPEGVAVIGSEDSPLARHTDPKLTTVRQPVEAMGERLASELPALSGGPAEIPRTWSLTPNSDPRIHVIARLITVRNRSSLP
jgi:DNA-binding LacI/PurR family transcriptional regulator